MSSTLLEPGRTIGQYVLFRRLGVGGVAEVWGAEHAVLGTRHALKVLTWASSSLRARLLREGRVQARLRHPNLLPVNDILDVNGVPGLLMPLVEGPSLQAVIAEGPLSPGEALALMRPIADGVRFAHARGLVHRDLKPANILLDLRRGAPVPRVADFGLVKDVDVQNTVAGVFMGTPAYSAPEQLRDASSVDHRADLFSLGVVLFQMLTGTLPFPGESPVTIYEQQVAGADLSSIPPELVGPLRSLLQVDRGARMASCGDLLAALPPGVSLDASSRLSVLARALAAQAVTSGPASSQTWSSAQPLPSDLPEERDRFVGRERELAVVSDKLSSGRLVTMVGPGGVGKTRLALRAARDRGGARFFDLSEARTLEEALYTLATRLDTRLGRDPIASVGRALVARPGVLFVLDNLEQIAEPMAHALSAWLDAAPEASFLVTSRQPLRIRGEQVVLIEPLSASDAAALFIARARLADPDFQPGAVVDDLVGLLDGLPLAIELAAARVRLMPPRRLLKRLDSRFRLLRSNLHGLVPRQRTLRATLDWSWNLLDADEKAALAQCSVFEGGFDMEAAEAIIALGEDAPWLEDVLMSLVDQSLLRVSTAKSEPRFSLLLSVKEYALEQLSGPDRAGAELRHGAYYAEYGAPKRWPDKGHLQRMSRQDLDNLLAAGRRAIARGDDAVAAEAVTLAASIIQRRGPIAAALKLYEQVIPICAPPNDRQMRNKHAWALTVAGQPDPAIAVAEESLALSLAAGDRSREQYARYVIGKAHRSKGRYPEAIAALEAAMAIREGHAAMATLLLGIVRAETGALATARDLFEQALALFRVQRDFFNVAGIQGNLGYIYGLLGDLDAAEAAQREVLALLQDNPDPIVEASTRGQLARIALRRGRLDAARQQATRALEMHREVGYRFHQGMWLSLLAELALIEGDFGEAQARSAEAVSAAEPYPPMLAGALMSVACVAMARGDREAAQAALDRAGSLKASATTACRLQILGALLAPPEAREAALERAASMAEGMGYPPQAPDRQDIAALRGEAPARPGLAVLLRGLA